MKTFNKSLLAGLIASATAVSVNAQDILDLDRAGFSASAEQSVAWVSAEGLELGNTSVTHRGFELELDDTLALNEADRILVTIDGTEFALDADSVFDTYDNGSPALSGNVVYDTASLVSLTEMAINLSASTLESNAQLTLGGFKLNMSNNESGDSVSVTVSAQRELSNNVYQDIDSVSGQLVEVVGQLAFGINRANQATGAINPEDRTEFATDNSSGDYQDQFQAFLIDNAVQYATVSGQGDVDLTVTGDFSFLDTDGDGEEDGNVTVSGLAGSYEISEDFQEIVVTGDATDVAGDGTSGIGLSFEFDGETEIPLMDAFASVEYTYQGQQAPSTDKFEGSLIPVLSWSLDATTSTFNYMPYGDNISQILYVTNNGSADASITVTARDSAGTAYGPVTLDTLATAKGVTKITGDVEDALMAEGFSGQGPVKLDISVNSGDVSVYGAYNVGGSDRGYVPAEK